MGHENEKGRLLIIDDDRVFLKRLALNMERRGFKVITAENIEQARQHLQNQTFNYALVDLKLGGENGLESVNLINKKCPDCHIIVFTAFGNIASAVSAIKIGADDYLAKPASTEAIEKALLGDKDSAHLPLPPEKPMPADRVKWEHILRVYEQSGHNVSETARLLGMHRRTLQRFLAKHAPPDERSASES